GIRHRWSEMVDLAAALRPRAHPPHHAPRRHGLALRHPDPHQVGSTPLAHARTRAHAAEPADRLIPWLQDRTRGQPGYSPRHFRQQIRAGYARGYDEWILWHPGSNYSEAALPTADGVGPRLARPEEEPVHRGPRALGVPVQ